MSDPTYSASIQHDRNGNRLVQGNGSVRVLDSGAKEFPSSGLATSLLGVASFEPGAVNVFEERMGHLRRLFITLTNLVVPTVDATTNGAQGTAVLLTFPRGNIQLLGASSNLTIVGDGTGITTTAAVVSAVGTVVPAVDATLTSTEANILPSYAATLTAGAGVVKGRGVTGAFFDNTTNTNATQLTANLNFAVPDAGSTANGTITVSGTIQITYYNHGDN